MPAHLIFLAFRDVESIAIIMAEEQAKAPLYCFTAEDGVEHCVWKISDADNNEKLQAAFGLMDKIYIADGHHRCASAVKVGLQRSCIFKYNSFISYVSFHFTNNV